MKYNINIPETAKEIIRNYRKAGRGFLEFLVLILAFGIIYNAASILLVLVTSFVGFNITQAQSLGIVSLAAFLSAVMIWK